MNWEDECFLLSKRKFRENANIINIFTQKKGKIEGIVYGGTSRKVRNYLQISNKLFVSHTSRNENRIGYFKTELIKPISPIYFDDKAKIICLNSMSSILKAILPENQPYKSIYKSLDDLLSNFKEKNWSMSYLYWEINLIKQLGYGFSIDSKKYNNSSKDKVVDVKLDDINYKIPSFLIFKKLESPNIKDICNGLNFTRNLMENKFFIPNNIRFPYSRKLLEKIFL